jgi:hypothetical protein
MRSPILRWSFVLGVAVWLVHGAAGCGSSPCSELCGCLADSGADEGICLDQCQAAVDAGAGERTDCLAGLAEAGMNQCNATCSAFDEGGADPDVGIHVVSATLGASCSAPAQIDTVGAACDGLSSCTCDRSCWFPAIDPAFGCAKDLEVRWVCNGGSDVKEVYFPAEADEPYLVELSCP